MQAVKLSAEARTNTGKGANRRLRATGRVPAVNYGVGNDPALVSVLPIDVVRILESGNGKNTILNLEVDGKDAGFAMIRDFQIDPVRRTLIHIDFLVVQETREVVIDVPVEMMGDAPFEKLGGQRRQVGLTVRLRCLPSAVPTVVTFDVGEMDKPEVVYANNLVLPEGCSPAYRYNFPVLVLSMGRGEDLEGEEGEEAGAEGADASGEAAAAEGGENAE
jgi:large subunit ribosomal protein L25